MNKHIDIRVIFDDLDEGWLYDAIPSDDINDAEVSFISFNEDIYDGNNYYTLIYSISLRSNNKYEGYYVMDDEVPDRIQYKIDQEINNIIVKPNPKVSYVLAESHSLTTVLDTLIKVYETINELEI